MQSTLCNHFALCIIFSLIWCIFGQIFSLVRIEWSLKLAAWRLFSNSNYINYDLMPLDAAVCICFICFVTSALSLSQGLNLWRSLIWIPPAPPCANYTRELLCYTCTTVYKTHNLTNINIQIQMIRNYKKWYKMIQKIQIQEQALNEKLHSGCFILCYTLK